MELFIVLSCREEKIVKGAWTSKIEIRNEKTGADFGEKEDVFSFNMLS